ncbi:MAG TPA: (d)CMP kinase [Prolixibacteraceae bacterium]|nr:(d)CMP kinase [Prolixibacteraceae bacterium]
MSEKPLIIAIDGFSSCGKSTLARMLARTLGYTYIDSGAMYRAITLFALRKNLITNGTPDKEAILKELAGITISFGYDQENGNNITRLNGENVEEEIRRPEVSAYVSPVSAIREIREAMVLFQRKLGENGGIVMDGRDIGTVVFPHANLKIFMTADPEIRAQRRYLELSLKGIAVSMDDIRNNIAQRDYMDQNREISPLRKAPDAIILDNSNLNIQEQLDWVLEKMNTIHQENDH